MRARTFPLRPRRLRPSSWLAVAAVAAVTVLAGCERPPVDSTQNGYRGTGMAQVYNPRTVAAQLERHQSPDPLPALPPAPEGSPTAGESYKNVQVLGHLSRGEFLRTMTSITAWVAPQEGCAYCHNPRNLAEDSVYTKIVARRMIQMTQNLNVNWQQHVGATGVTCYTCHRGQPVPAEIWFKPVPQPVKANFIGDLAGQNQPATTVGLASLPSDPFTPYLLDKQNPAPIRVNGPTALPTGNRASTKQAEHTYGLMMHMSKSLGVNCTYCHNTQNFGKWEGSPPQRVTAWHGLQMARDINTDYLVPLTSAFPANRLGPLGDVAKVNCASCHQGAFKPLLGVALAKEFPALTTQQPAKAASSPAASSPAQ